MAGREALRLFIPILRSFPAIKTAMPILRLTSAIIVVMTSLLIARLSVRQGNLISPLDKCCMGGYWTIWTLSVRT